MSDYNAPSTGNIKVILEGHKKIRISPEKAFESTSTDMLETKLINNVQKRFSKSFIEYRDIIHSYEKISYFENSTCPLYFGYMKEVVESAFGDAIKYSRIDKSVDFILEFRGQKFKVKHLTSCCQYMPLVNKDREQYGWEYKIDHNKIADAFLLSAFDDKKSLNCLHLWFVRSKSIFESRKIKRQLWNRKMLILRNSIKVISYMDKFELKKELEKLKRMKLCKTDNEHRSVANLLLFEKQQEIFETKGKKRSIEYIVEESIEICLGKRLEIDNSTDGMNDAVQKMLNTRLRMEKGKRLGLPPIEYENEAYNLIIERQKLSDITGELRSIKEIIDEAIECGIDSVT